LRPFCTLKPKLPACPAKLARRWCGGVGGFLENESWPMTVGLGGHGDPGEERWIEWMHEQI